jgi:hypothetical protein
MLNNKKAKARGKLFHRYGACIVGKSKGWKAVGSDQGFWGSTVQGNVSIDGISGGEEVVLTE